MSFLLRLFVSPTTAFAIERFTVMATGVRLNFSQVMANLTRFIAVMSVGVCTLIFLVGAGMLTVSRGDETMKSNAKNAMKNSLIGLAFTLGSYGIIRTILYFVYEWAP